MFDRPRDQSFQLLDIERFFDVIERSAAHGFHRRSDRGVRRDHQNLRPVRPAFQMANQLQARHARHLQIGDNHVEAFAGQLHECFAAAGDAFHLMTGGTERIGD